MATLALKPCVHVKSYGGSGPEYDRLAISGAATLIDGDLVVKVNNTIDVCGADPTNISGLMQSSNTATVPGNSLLQFVKVKPADTFEMTLWSTTASSATCADADLDASYVLGISKQTVSGNVAWVADVDDIVNTRVRVIGRHPLSAATDTYPRVFVQFLSTCANTYQ